MSDKQTVRVYGGVFIGFGPEVEIDENKLSYNDAEEVIWSELEDLLGQKTVDELIGDTHVEVEVDSWEEISE